MTRDEAIKHLNGCTEYIRHSVAWSGTDEQQCRVVLDGRFTADQLEAFALIMRNEPELFKLKELSE